MTTQGPRYELQTGAFVSHIHFDESQVSMLRSIKDEDSFVEAVRNIAELYGCLIQEEAETLSAGEFKATLSDLQKLSSTLLTKLETMPQAVDAELWRFTIDPFRRDPIIAIERLKILLQGFSEEADDALARNRKRHKAGRPQSYANWQAAKLLRNCFESFAIPIMPNQWMDPELSPATACLQLIFLSCGTVLSRSAIEVYLRPDQES
jgi:hypothetical protein